MENRKILFAALTTFLLSATASPAGRQSKLYSGHLTRKTFDRVEPLLQQLEPGTALKDSGIRWTYWRLAKRGKTTGVRAESDGWISFLSGGIEGARGIGSLTGVSEEFLYGMHVFGYLWRNATLVPRYRLKTRARRSTEAEFEEIDPKVLGGRGRVQSGGEVFFYRDVTIEGVEALRFTEPETTGARTEKLPRRDFKGFVLSLASQEAFSKILPKIEALETGCQLLDAIAELGGLYTTFDFGKDYYLFLDGFLRSWMEESSDYPLVSIGRSGRYEVWPFGYLEQEEPRVQVALVFKNDRLEMILQDASRDAVATFLAERSR